MADRIEQDVRIDVDEIIIDRSDTGPEGTDTAAIHAEIRETRERMGHTLDDLSERLNPDHLKDQVKENIKENIREATIGRAEDMARHAADRVTETRHNLMDTIRDNPLPAAMVGIGLGWLIWNGRKEDHHPDINIAYRGYRSPYEGNLYDRPGAAERAGHRVSNAAGEVKHRAGELTDQAEGAVTELADRTREAASDVADRARSAAEHLAQEPRYRTHRLEDRFQGALHESPLAVGAAAIALGMAAGLSAPSTRKESELMGGARDHLVERAREAADEATDKVQRVAERVVGEAQSTAQEAAQQEGLASGPQKGMFSGTGPGAPPR